MVRKLVFGFDVAALLILLVSAASVLSIREYARAAGRVAKALDPQPPNVKLS